MLNCMMSFLFVKFSLWEILILVGLVFLVDKLEGNDRDGERN